MSIAAATPDPPRPSAAALAPPSVDPPASENAALPAARKNPAHHYLPLDGLRGLAILLVLSLHFTEGQTRNIWVVDQFFALLKSGWCGVDLFFVLSGFLITGILVRAKTQAHYFRNFYARRALRIFPAYYCYLFLVFFIAPRIPFLAHLQSATGHVSPWYFWLYGSNALPVVTGSVDTGTALPLNHFWSLAVEEHFYLVWPLVIYLCTVRRALFVCATGIAVALLARVTWLALTGNVYGAYEFTPFRMDSLLFGCATALLIANPQWRLKLQRWTPAVVAIGWLPLLLLARFTDWDRFAGYFGFSLLAFYFSCLVAMVVLFPQGLAARFFTNRTLRFFGRYSYGMYVYHMLLIILMQRYSDVFARLFHSSTGGFFAIRVCMLAAIVAAAFISWHLFERPFIALKRYFESSPVPANPVGNAASPRA